MIYYTIFVILIIKQNIKMKEQIFNKYVDEVAAIFRINKKDLFSKDKSTMYADARHLLYYLCYMRPMRVNMIQRYMEQNGYEAKHANIIYGIKSVDGKVRSDNDYLKIVKNITENVFYE